MNTIKYTIILSFALLVASCSSGKSSFDATGTFEATEVVVSAEATGKILNFNIEEGQIINIHQEVGLIDSLQLYLQKMSMLANAEGVRIQRPDIKTQTAAILEQIETLKREKERTIKLIEANAANSKQLDDINSQIEVLQKQLSAQTSSLQKSSANIGAQSSALEIQVAQLEDMIEKCKITSPISGTVINKYAEAGELANAGKPLFKVADLQSMYLRAYITNDQLVQLKLNDNLNVFVDAGNGEMKKYEGTISWISDKSEFTPKTIQTKNERANLVYAVKIAVKNDGYLKIGMYGEVSFN
ncbi:MAG: HlyD family efflux transporter periplasmic adaptor subunit [Proteiniphilum sp.]|nr:HlyD family efflux transporter periplasmic adaptor subunit [Proteiniphilum sp.]